MSGENKRELFVLAFCTHHNATVLRLNVNHLFVIVERRHQMARFMHEHGATYAKDLDDSVTHLLICGDAHDRHELESEDGGINPKIAWALEENEARQRARIIRRQRIQTGNKRRRVIEDEDDLKADILIVWSEWFWDCLAAYGKNKLVDRRPTPIYSLNIGRHEESAYTIDHPRPVLKALANSKAVLHFQVEITV